ncbi:MAG TPA: NlpC/P60 family protein [Eubacteriales bacterium]|nr:NlpC/P60 family protein [Clostridia bacterium]HRV72786.1 NlpC/P60 family protein [Eubacteriales bacterium]
MNKSNEFIALLKGEIGNAIYVWGGDGELLDDMKDAKAWIKKCETSAKNAERSQKYYQSLLDAGKTDIRAFDCSGLMYWALKQLKLLSSDRSSRGLYAMCDKLNAAEIQAGDLVFKHNGEKIVHVGAYIGDGYVIECKGRDVGVVKTRLSGAGWNRYGRFPNMYDAAQTKEDYSESGDTTMRTLTLTTPMMRGDDVRALQEKLLSLGRDLGKSGVDGVYGKSTKAAVLLTKTLASKCKPDAVANDELYALLGL